MVSHHKNGNHCVMTANLHNNVYCFCTIIMITADGYKECQRKSIFFGVKSSFACPEPGQTPDMVSFCNKNFEPLPAIENHSS